MTFAATVVILFRNGETNGRKNNRGDASGKMRREGKEIILNYLAPACLNFNNLKRREKEERERKRSQRQNASII